MKKLSESNKIEVVSEALSVALGASALAALLYFIDTRTGFLKTLDITQADVVMIGCAAVGFCLLWVLMDKWFFTPYVKLFEKREKLTVGAEEDFKHKEIEIAEMLEQYEVKTIQARGIAAREKAEIINKAKVEANAKIEAAKKVAQDATAIAKQNLAARRAELQNDARKEAESLAQQMIGKVLGQ